jgi:uncharacterized membrane protein
MSVNSHLRTTFLSGAFAAIPIAVTVAIIVYVERLTREPLRGIGLGYPGLGIIVAVLAIYLTGLFVSSLVGKFVLRRLDAALERVPVLRELYKAWKQVSLTPGGGEGIYGKVVLVPDGRGEQHVLAFSSGDCVSKDCEIVAVFVPNAPNPVTGRVAFVHRKDIIVLDMTSEEAFKLLISSGNYVPAELAAAMERRQLSK